MQMSSVCQYNIEMHFSCDVHRLTYNMYLTIIKHYLSIIETIDLIQNHSSIQTYWIKKPTEVRQHGGVH